MVADYYSTDCRYNRTCILQVLPVFHKNHSAVQPFGQQIVWKSTSQQKCHNFFTVLQTQLQQRWNHRRINQVFMLIHVDRKFYPRTARLSWFTRVHARGTFAPGKQPCFAGWQHGSELSTRPFHRSARIIVLDHDVSYGNATFPSDIIAVQSTRPINERASRNLSSCLRSSGKQKGPVNIISDSYLASLRRAIKRILGYLSITGTLTP